MPGWRTRAAIAKVTRRPELLTLLAVTAALNLWDLSRNGWANTYYSAAVRSMASSWHDFLFASLDKSGLMTVDKPPLAFWVQALSARVFGFTRSAAHPASADGDRRRRTRVRPHRTALRARRRFRRRTRARNDADHGRGRAPQQSRRAPDPLLRGSALVRCSGSSKTGRARWLLLSAVAVGLGFETKMGVALMVVPGIAAAWLYVAPRGRRVAVRDLLAFGVVTMLVGGAWPLLVELTPASRATLDLGHERQPHHLADLWLQRPRADRGASRGTTGVRRRRDDVRWPDRAVSASPEWPRRPGWLAARVRARRDRLPARAARACVEPILARAG